MRETTTRMAVIIGLLALGGLTHCRSPPPAEQPVPSTSPSTSPPPPVAAPGAEATPPDSGPPASPPTAEAPPKAEPPAPPAEVPAEVGRAEACSPSGWCWKGSSYVDHLTAVWAVDDHQAFAVGPPNNILSWRDGQVRFLWSDTPQRLHAIWGSSPEEIWAVGEAGTIIHWNGKRWTRVREGTEFLHAVTGTGPRDVWAAGHEGALLHWDGLEWRRVDSGTQLSINALWASGPRDVWMAVYEQPEEGRARHSTLHRWDGTSWTLVRTFGGVICSFLGFGPDDLWAAGTEGLFAHWDGKQWTRVGGLDESSDVWRLWGRDSSDVWLVGGSLMLRWDGQRFQRQRFEHFQVEYLSAIAGGPAGPLVAVDMNGMLLHYQGRDEWTLQRPSSSLDRREFLDSVWASAPDNAWAAGGGYLAHWDGRAWSRATEAGMHNRSVSGTSASDVWAAGWDQNHDTPGTVVHHFDGRSWTQNVWLHTGAAMDVWAHQPDLAFMVCHNGNILRWDGVSWDSVGRVGRYLHGVHGSGREDVWAVGTGGALFQWNGRQWVNHSVDTWHSFNAVWSFGPEDVWIATDEDTLLHWDGHALSSRVLGTGGFLMALYGTAPDDLWVLASNGTLAHWDGRAWALESTGLPSSGLESLSGAGGRLFSVGRYGIAHREPPVPRAP